MDKSIKTFIELMLKEALSNVASKRQDIKVYKNIHHVMMKDMEVLNESKNEVYTFMLNEGWKITFHNKDYITISKE